MKKYILILLILLLASPVFAGTMMTVPSTTTGITAQNTNSDCNQAQYYGIGTFCCDTDDGKCYKGTGAAIEEIGAGAGMTYPDVGVGVSTGSAWDTSLSTDGSGDCGTGAVCLGDHTHSGYISPTEIDGSTAASPTAATLKNGPIITNYGQAAADVNITLPTTEANLSFIATVGTAQGANYWRFTSTAGGDIYLNGSVTGKNYVQYSTPSVGNYFGCFTFKTGASTWSWICTDGNGSLATN